MITVVLHKDANPDAFAEELNAAGYSYTQLEFVKRVFSVDTTLDSFTLKESDLIQDAYISADRQASIAGFTNQDIVLDSSVRPITSGSYALARIIRRDPPWNYNYINKYIQTSFKSNRTGEGVDIYICDTGVKINEVEFEGRAFDVTSGYSIDHGTVVASFAAGKTSGVAKKATLWNCYCSDVTNEFTMASAINAAISHYQSRSGTNRPAVLNLSWGGYVQSLPASTAALEAAIDEGIVVCIAAGNNSSDTDNSSYYPIQDMQAEAISIGAIGMDDTPWVSFDYAGNGTNWGTRVDIYAPGDEVLGRKFNNVLSKAQGTSFASPIIAGIIACMLEGYPRLTSRAQVAIVKQRLIDNATTGRLTSPDNYYGLAAGNPKINIENPIIGYLDPYKLIEGFVGITPL